MEGRGAGRKERMDSGWCIEVGEDKVGGVCGKDISWTYNFQEMSRYSMYCSHKEGSSVFEVVLLVWSMRTLKKPQEDIRPICDCSCTTLTRPYPPVSCLLKLSLSCPPQHVLNNEILTDIDKEDRKDS